MCSEIPGTIPASGDVELPPAAGGIWSGGTGPLGKATWKREFKVPSSLDSGEPELDQDDDRLAIQSRVTVQVLGFRVQGSGLRVEG